MIGRNLTRNAKMYHLRLRVAKKHLAEGDQTDFYVVAYNKRTAAAQLESDVAFMKMRKKLKKTNGRGMSATTIHRKLAPLFRNLSPGRIIVEACI